MVWGWPDGTDWSDARDVAIELNNALTAWVGFTELLEAEPDGQHAAEDRRQATATPAPGL